MNIFDKIKNKTINVLASFSQLIGETNINFKKINLKIIPCVNSQWGDFQTVYIQSLNLDWERKNYFGEKIAKRLQSNYKNFFSSVTYVPIVKIEKKGVVSYSNGAYINYRVKNKFLNKYFKIYNRKIKLYKHKKDHYNIEFLSANPTGLMHLGHTRNAAFGNALANIWKCFGINVTKEYYINDWGNQINILAYSVLVRYLQMFNSKKVTTLPEDFYHGKEIISCAQKLKDEVGNKYVNCQIVNNKIVSNSINTFIRNFAVNYMLGEIKNTLTKSNIEFDIWSKESSLYEYNIDKVVLDKLKPYTYVQDKATFLATTKNSNDDKDRVLIKEDGSYTYFLPDIAYHYNKFMRNYSKYFIILGNDHIGYEPRLKCAIKLLGYNPEKLHVFFQQMIHLTKNGEEVKMSKRSGESYTWNDLISDIGVNSILWWMLSTTFESSHLNIDIEKSKEKSDNNPLYYITNTIERINDLVAKNKLYITKKINLTLLTNDVEHELIIKMCNYIELIGNIANNYEVHKLCSYLQSLTVLFNSYMANHEIINNSSRNTHKISKQRLNICIATRNILKHGLKLLGIE